jgi:hypothetical protein
MRDHSTPVAKGTILSADQKNIVAGRELGNECCEVGVNYILKRDAILPRPVGKVTTIAQAQGRPIAWPYKHVCLCFFSSFLLPWISQFSYQCTLYAAGRAEIHGKASLTSRIMREVRNHNFDGLKWN